MPRTLEEGGRYRIKVAGYLDPGWSDQLDGMEIRVEEGADARPVGILEGNLEDQAALSGVLDALYQLHLPVIALEKLDD